MPQPQEPVNDSTCPPPCLPQPQLREGSSQAESIPERSKDATQAGHVEKKINPSKVGTVIIIELFIMCSIFL